MGPASPTRGVVVGISLKAYFGQAATLTWVDAVTEVAGHHPSVAAGRIELVLLPSTPLLPAVVERVAGTGVRVGAQDVFWADAGPYTGETTGELLAELGVAYAEIGHAERKRLMGETGEMIRAKTEAAVRNGLVPILCIGETERGSVDDAAEACAAQLAGALGGLTTASPVVVAYEPEWAIGADRPASIDHIAGVCEALADWLDARPALAGSRVIYGGSAGPGLLDALGGAADGLFLGRFAHDPSAVDAVLTDADRRLTGIPVDAPGAG